jgi:hypothetical protein
MLISFLLCELVLEAEFGCPSGLPGLQIGSDEEACKVLTVGTYGKGRLQIGD